MNELGAALVVKYFRVAPNLNGGGGSRGQGRKRDSPLEDPVGPWPLVENT